MSSKVCKKFVNNWLADHLEKCGLFSNFQYGFRSSLSTTDQTDTSDRITSALNQSGTTQTVAHDISKAFNRVWHVGLLHKLKSYEISGPIFGLTLLFSVIDNFEWFWMGSLQKNIQLRIQWRLIFAIATCCYRLWLWVVYFTYFKIKQVFF